MILGIIPARSGSKGIKDKNIYPLCGKPLIEWTVDAIEKSYIKNYIISTDNKFIIDKYNGVSRPKYLCQDDSNIIDTIKIHLDMCNICDNYTTIILLQPTSPLRTAEDINTAIETFNKSGRSSLYSGYYMGIKHKNKTYDKHIDKPHFQRNGAIFIAKRELIEQGKLWDENVIEFEMPSYRSIDIDSMEDMKHAELLICGGVLDL